MGFYLIENYVSLPEAVDTLINYYDKNIIHHYTQAGKVITLYIPNDKFIQDGLLRFVFKGNTYDTYQTIFMSSMASFPLLQQTTNNTTIQQNVSITFEDSLDFKKVILTYLNAAPFNAYSYQILSNDTCQKLVKETV